MGSISDRGETSKNKIPNEFDNLTFKHKITVFFDDVFGEQQWRLNLNLGKCGSSKTNKASNASGM